MKLAVIVSGVGLCGALLGTSLAEDPKPAPAPEAKPADLHFIEGGELFFMVYPANDHKLGTVVFGYKTEGDSEYKSEGAILFRDFTDRVYSTKTWFKTRPAKPDDLYVGRRVIYPRMDIKNRRDLEETVAWNFGYISKITDDPDRVVMVAGRSLPPLDPAQGARVIVEGDADPKIALSGKEDAHFFHPEHWLVYVDRGEPDADGHDVRMALAIKAPAKAGEEGTFLRLDTGEVVTSKYAYKSRPATKADLKTGLRIVLAERGEVPNRDRAYRDLWWTGDLTSYDASTSVAKVGNHTVSYKGMRVVQ